MQTLSRDYAVSFSRVPDFDFLIKMTAAEVRCSLQPVTNYALCSRCKIRYGCV
jgi:hypothetical protein